VEQWSYGVLEFWSIGTDYILDFGLEVGDN
jgi:hypothetical protein